MLRCSALLAGLLMIAGCASPVDTAVMPPYTGLADPSNAIQYTSWAFASPARTRNDPASAARAVAALDYVAGAISTSPAWQHSSPLVANEMLHARQAVRRTLGILPAAPSQAVVNSMIGASLALAHHDRTAALAALNAPFFTLGPEQTLAVLTDLPPIRQANIATAHAEGALNGTFCAFGCFSGM